MRDTNFQTFPRIHPQKQYKMEKIFFVIPHRRIINHGRTRNVAANGFFFLFLRQHLDLEQCKRATGLIFFGLGPMVPLSAYPAQTSLYPLPMTVMAVPLLLTSFLLMWPPNPIPVWASTSAAILRFGGEKFLLQI